MTCSEIEVLLADYIDGALPADEKSAVDAHLGQCSACAEFAQDAQAAVGFMERVAEVTPPPDLLTRIAHQIPHGKHSSRRVPGWRKLFGRYIQPVLQPRFAMGMAMTILSFSLLGRFTGIEPRQLKPSDLNPAKVWQTLDDRAQRSWDRAVKYYESIRLVYEMRSRLREWTEAEESDRKSGAVPTAGQTQKSAVAPALPDKDRTNHK